MPPSSATALSSLQAYKPRSVQDVSTEAETKYDLPNQTSRLSSLRGLVGNLQSSVEAVDPSVTGRTSGTFTTEGQRQALVSKERAPILGDLSKQQGYLGEAQQGFNTSQTLASQMASALMAQDQQAYQRLLDQYNTASAQEKAAEEKRRFEEQMAEDKRQFDAQMAANAKSSSGGGYDISGIMSQINALNNKGATEKKYIGNDDFRGRLAYEASKGNNNAKIALKYAGNDGRYDGVVASQAEYSALKNLGIKGNYTYLSVGNAPSQKISSVVYGKNTTSTAQAPNRLVVR